MKVDISRTIVALISTLGLGGCATHSFARVASPAKGPETVVALVGQTCDRENDPNWSSADVLGLDLRIRVANTGASVLTFDPWQVTLRSGRHAFHPRRAGTGGEIPPEATRTFLVHFWERDADLACNVPMALEVGRSLSRAGSAVTLPSLAFLAGNEDS